MNRRIKAKWLEALRSGDYKQGRGQLYDDLTGKFCCLGVLCKVQGANLDEINNGYMPTGGYLAGASYRALRHLAHMNDKLYKSFSFSAIADFIETNL